MTCKSRRNSKVSPSCRKEWEVVGFLSSRILCNIVLCYFAQSSLAAYVHGFIILVFLLPSLVYLPRFFYRSDFVFAQFLSCSRLTLVLFLFPVVFLLFDFISCFFLSLFPVFSCSCFLFLFLVLFLVLVLFPASVFIFPLSFFSRSGFAFVSFLCSSRLTPALFSFRVFFVFFSR